MIYPGKPSNEAERLSSLYSYGILDTLPEENIDAISRIASEICGTNMSLVTLIDADRQWFKSVHGVESGETAREESFCAHAILTPKELFEVPDSSKDERFFDNPYVTGEPHVAFYAGVPLVNTEGYPLGTLCVLDDKPKTLTENQRLSLQALARQVVSLFELRKANQELEDNRKLLQEANEELEKFAYVIAHDLKSPCNNIISLTELLTAALEQELDDEKKQLLAYLSSSSQGMKDLVDSVLRHARNIHSISDHKDNLSFATLMEEVKMLVPLPVGFTISYEPADATIHASAAGLKQILLNLCTNAVKYNDKTEGYVKVNFIEEAYHYTFSVADNGMGIPENSYHDIFGIFNTLGQKDRFDNTGSGIGLSTVKKLVERLGGTISVSSVVGKGSTFTFTVKK